jgi:hypothetical protein
VSESINIIRHFKPDPVLALVRAYFVANTVELRNTLTTLINILIVYNARTMQNDSKSTKIVFSQY